MDQETISVTLGWHGRELLRDVQNRHPEWSVTEILEKALERFGREFTTPQRSPEQVRAWLDELATFSERISPRSGETFSREMIYQDHP